MKTIGIEQATLDSCIHDDQQERVVVTRDGHPIALVVGLEGLDAEQMELTQDVDFWRLISDRRRQKTISRAELEARLAATEV